MHVPNHEILCWFLTAEYFFYATGHQPTFATIHWEAGFVGVDGSLQLNFIRAILIGIYWFLLILFMILIIRIWELHAYYLQFLGFNTFGSHIVMGLMLPLLNVIPLALSIFNSKVIKVTKLNLQKFQQEEIILHHNHANFHAELFSISGRYILLHASRVSWRLISNQT